MINKSKTGCEYQFKDKNRMGLHREYFHEAVRYSCKLCEQKTEEKPNLKFHSIEVHEGERYSFLQSVRLKSRIIMWLNSTKKQSMKGKKTHVMAANINQDGKSILKCRTLAAYSWEHIKSLIRVKIIIWDALWVQPVWNKFWSWLSLDRHRVLFHVASF